MIRSISHTNKGNQQLMDDKDFGSKNQKHPNSKTSSAQNEIKSILKSPAAPSYYSNKHNRSVKIMQKSQEHETPRLKLLDSTSSNDLKKYSHQPNFSMFIDKKKFVPSLLPSLDISKKNSIDHISKKNSLVASKQDTTNYLDDSENDIFNTNRQTKVNMTKNQIFKTKLSKKIINKIGFITQKMTPNYQKSILLLESVENKILNDINFFADQTKTVPHIPDEIPCFNEVFLSYTTENHPIEISPFVWNLLEVRQMEFYYFKIRSKTQAGPLQFNMKQSNQQSSFKIFVSTSNAYPTKFSSEHIFTAKCWKIKSEGSKMFLCDFIYFSFVSEHNMLVKMKFSFGDLQVKIDQKVSTQRYFSRQSIQHMTTEMLFDEVAKIKQRRKLKNQQVYGGGQKDIIKENKETIIQFNQEQQDNYKQARKQEGEEHSLQVINKKKRLDTQEKQFKVLKVKARVAIKTIKINIQIINNAKTQKKKLTEGWFVMLYIAQLASKIFYTYKHKVHTIQQSRLMAFQVRRNLKRIQKRLSLTEGQSIEDRAKFDSRLCIGMLCRQIQQKHQSLAVLFLVPILYKRAVIYTIQEKVLNTYQKIKKVQLKFREFMIKKRNFQMLLQIIWDKYSYKAHCQSVLNSLDDKQLMEWYVSIQNDKQQAKQVKEIFVKLYFQERIRAYFIQIKQYLINQRQMKILNPRRLGQLFMKKAHSFLVEENFSLDEDENIQLMINKQNEDKLFLEVKKPRLFMIPLERDIQQIYMKVFQLSTQQVTRINLNNQSNMKMSIFGQSPLIIQNLPKSPGKKK